jgi:PIN domain nuclease of toxin-antitoxin system
VRILLDTCALLWFANGDAALTSAARSAIEDPANTCYLSVASAWEIAIKYGKGHLGLPDPPDKFVRDQLSLNNFGVLQIGLDHALYVPQLPKHHADRA